MYTSVHLNVSQESYSELFHLSFDLKALYIYSQA